MDPIYTPDELLDMISDQQWETYRSNYENWLQTYEPQFGHTGDN